MKYKAGDIVLHTENDEYQLAKILRTETFESAEENWSAYHVMLYSATTELPTPEALASLVPEILHLPVATEDIDENWSFHSHQPVSAEELEGFHQYLKYNDFKRYIEETGVDHDQLLDQAAEHYRRACALAEQDKHEEAVDAFAEAIDCFPLFSEALDGLGMSEVALGNFEEALQDFEESYRLNPESQAAVYFLGECLAQLERHAEAIPYFEKCVENWPESELYRVRLEEARKALPVQ